MRSVNLILSIALVLGATGAAAQSKPPLNQVREIDDGLLMVGIADEIRKRCDNIDARMINAWSRIRGLESRAKSLGYTAEEIEDYVTSDEEKARMRRRGEALLRQRGFDPASTGDYCTFGREEIARGSQIGVLLRER
ncbi:hypothetical protein SAMN05421853_102205 [Roseivivax halotolerans]|jgi:hypothetical protein|uniref:Uncharacterized protein n=1 Tax=Roseivivax halotolerans TaxID=93684 RepID=A0A1I5W9M0_9RHOB|nr:DUF5333 domain-containing protein [Roseivivax halotolerans]SFQ16317.1 hypothetical protein SAMN05421853_102205 [Roseivivax halotolerans]